MASVPRSSDGESSAKRQKQTAAVVATTPSFQFSTATRVVFGPGSVSNALKSAKELGVAGERALLVTGSNKARARPIVQSLEASNVAVAVFQVTAEPTTMDADAGAAAAREHKADMVIGYGGGSVVDTGKAIAMLVTNGGAALDYMEVIGKGLPITKPSLPYIAIPTTSGTGAEVTKNAVMKSEEHKQKASLRSVFMYPTLAVVDPLLTLSVPPAVTAATGLDAFTQCLEPLVSCLSNPMCDALAAKGLAYGARALRRAYTNGDDVDARTDMSLCSLFGGLALANSKLGAVHGFAGVLGGLLPNAPHGAICAALLPQVIVVNNQAMEQRDPTNAAVAKYREAARIVLARDATPTELAAWVKDLTTALNVPRLSTMGLQESQWDAVCTKSSGSSSMKGNPIKLTHEELMHILASS